MSKQVIEVDGEAVGVVVPDADGVKFVAVKYAVWELDAVRFHTADDVRAAIRQLMANHRRKSSNATGPVTAAA